jgi:hypothetical protein
MEAVDEKLAAIDQAAAVLRSGGALSSAIDRVLSDDAGALKRQRAAMLTLLPDAPPPASTRLSPGSVRAAIRALLADGVERRTADVVAALAPQGPWSLHHIQKTLTREAGAGFLERPRHGWWRLPVVAAAPTPEASS